MQRAVRTKDASGVPAVPAARRHNNPRGQGAQLRDDLIEAASSLLAETGDASQLTLRAVARRVGIAATSVYLHFRDTEELVGAVIERRVPELGAVITAAREGIGDPCAALAAGSRAYCNYGLEHPGYYRVLFQVTMVQRPGSEGGPHLWAALVRDVRLCLQHRNVEDEAEAVAQLLWAGLHGMVSLRINQPAIGWPPLDKAVDQFVARLLTGCDTL
jgi:AcrR family transcriptional regulator